MKLPVLSLQVAGANTGMEQENLTVVYIQQGLISAVSLETVLCGRALLC